MSIPPTIRSRVYQRHYALGAMLIAGALIVYLVGNNLFPLIDRDEPRFAEASRQMLDSGDWTMPRFLDQPRLNKPILIYWLQAGSMKIFGETAFAARLPSALAAVATLGVLLAALPRVIGHRRTLWAAFIFATALMPAYLAKVCMVDAVQHLFISVTMLCLYTIWRGVARPVTLLAFGAAVGLALLTKGPPVLMFLGTTLAALWAINLTIDLPAPNVLVRIESLLPSIFLRVAIVIAIAIGVCVPWVMHIERARPGAVISMFTSEVVQRGASAKEGHGGPPGFYFATFWVTYFPWCLLFPAALVHAWKRRNLPWVRFCLAATLGPWLFLEIYKTKLPHYWLPSYPFMAILTADVVIRGMRARIMDFRDRPFLIGAAVWASAASGFAALVIAVPFFGDAPWSSFIIALAMAIGIIALAWGVVLLLAARRLPLAALAMGLGNVALVAFGACAYLPNVQALTLSHRVAMRLREIDATVPGEVQMIGFKEPSVAFYQGGTIREQSAQTFLATTPPDRWPRWTVIDDQAWRETLKAKPDVEARMIARGTFSGANIADGKRHTVVYIFEKKLQNGTMP